MRVFEKVLKRQLSTYLQVNNAIYKYQSGFLPLHSTVTQLCYLVHDWQTAIDKQQTVQVAFLDLSKAYNRVSIDGLLYKLLKIGFSKPALTWMESFLGSRQQRVKIGDRFSEWGALSSGIPQGTVLGPTLFLIYINDLPAYMKTTPSIFADDSTVYTKGLDDDAACRELTTELDAAQNWAESWGMSFNPDKSEWLTISSKRKSQQPSGTNEQLKMKGNLVTAVATHKHLGIVFNRSLTWSDQISTVRTKCARRMGILRKMSHLFNKKIIKKFI